MTVTLSRATADDVPATVPADGRAFGLHHEERDIEDLRPVLDPDRFDAACLPDRDPYAGTRF
ncbi:MAG: hypothetical protein L0I24_22130 [Pseudonocardia sp.]|nr:hypothetical protein [Pseudonocardia sp.]